MSSPSGWPVAFVFVFGVGEGGVLSLSTAGLLAPYTLHSSNQNPAATKTTAPETTAAAETTAAT